MGNYKKNGGVVYMKLVWKGKLTKDKGLPKPEIPKDAKVFLGEESSWHIYIIGIAIFILAFVLIKIKQSYIQGLQMKRIGYLIGFALALLFLVVHELIHGLSCPRDCTVNYYYSIHGITCYPLDSMTRNRYVFMTIAPAVFLGFIPMIIWIFIPVKFVMLNSIMFTFSLGNLGVSAADLYNLLKALIKAPKESLIQASGAKVYWFKNS